MKFVSIIFIITSTLLLTDEVNKVSYAYLDPGTGSYIFQIIIATIIGGIFGIKLFWQKIILFFKKIFINGKDGND